MKNKSKKPLVIIIFLVLVAIISTVTFFYTRETKNKESFKMNTSDFIKDDGIKQEGLNEGESELISEQQEEKKEESNIDNLPSGEQPSSNQTNKTTKSDNTQSKTNNNSTQNNTQKQPEVTPKQETPKQEQPKQENTQPVVPSCTPKKFDMSFVRADFSSFEACKQMGDKYKEIGYGYFCDNYQDDCGTTYYMLTLYERNTGIKHDFHTIQLP